MNGPLLGSLKLAPVLLAACVASPAFGKCVTAQLPDGTNKSECPSESVPKPPLLTAPARLHQIPCMTGEGVCIIRTQHPLPLRSSCACVHAGSLVAGTTSQLLPAPIQATPGRTR